MALARWRSSVYMAHIARIKAREQKLTLRLLRALDAQRRELLRILDKPEPARLRHWNRYYKGIPSVTRNNQARR